MSPNLKGLCGSPWDINSKQSLWMSWMTSKGRSMITNPRSFMYENFTQGQRATMISQIFSRDVELFFFWRSWEVGGKGNIPGTILSILHILIISLYITITLWVCAIYRWKNYALTNHMVSLKEKMIEWKTGQNQVYRY